MINTQAPKIILKAKSSGGATKSFVGKADALVF
jgi:hypothetical protein